jgi:hypothetical protein
MLGLARIRTRTLICLDIAAFGILAALLLTSVAAVGDDDRMSGDPRSAGPVFVLDEGRFSAFDAPGVSANELIDVNRRGQIAGTYVPKNGVSHGFLNDRGELLGVYVDADGNPHGFHRSPRGRITTLDAPGAVLTLPFDINDRGRIVGFTTDALPIPDAVDVHGFVLKHGPAGRFSRIDVPGAPRTLASGIDDRGRIVGIFESPNAAVPESLQNLGSTGVAAMALGSWNA